MSVPTLSSVDSGTSPEVRDPALAAVLSKVTDKGEWPISKVDEANIPVNIVLTEPDAYQGKWLLLADNFKPCNSSIDIEIYEVEADCKEDLQAVVDSFIVPLYKAAVRNLEKDGHLFFWTPRREAR
ncbi:MAG: hypothetical protein ACFB21_08080 [Opitutales bacterium]